MSHHMTNRKWMTLHFFFLQAFHHDQQIVSVTVFCLLPCCFVMSHLMNRIMWVCIFTLSLHVLFHDQQMVSKFFLFSSLPHHVSSYDQQVVSGTTFFFERQFDCILSHEQGVSDTTFLEVVSSCPIPWPTGGESHCVVSLSRQSHYVSSHDQQNVSSTTLF